MLGQEINTNLCFQDFPIDNEFQFLSQVILLEVEKIWGASEIYLSCWTDEQSDRSLTGQQSVLIKADASCTRSPLCPSQTYPRKSGTPT